MAIFQHKYNKICPTGVIIKFVIDTRDDSRGKPVALVLMNAAEVAIFHHEVTSTNALPTDGVAIVADPKSYWEDREGKLWLMTYPQLSEILAASPAHLDEDLSLLLHMGCGQYTWDMVKACHDLWEWASGWEVGLGKPIVCVYTISNLEESIYCDAPMSNLSTEGVRAPRFEWVQPEMFGAAISRVQQEFVSHAEIPKALKESQQEDNSHEELSSSGQMSQQLPKHTNRAVVFTSESKLLETYEQQGCPPKGYAQVSGVAEGKDLSTWVKLLLQRQLDFKTILVAPTVGTIGTVRNLGTVLVLPASEGLFFDERLSQVVWRKDIPMSKAEVRYAFRVACCPSNSADRHMVSIFTTEAEFGKLPPAPTDPPAFTGDFPAVLLYFCDHSYLDGGDKTSPIRLPEDEEMIDEYLRRLELRGLTKSCGGPLTDLGRLTSWWHQNGVRDLNVANLLAIASTAQGARGSALMQIAAVINDPESPLMSHIASFLRFQIPDGRSAEFYRLLEDEVLGFARSYIKRGPIWIAVAVWARQRTYRDPAELAMAKDFCTCDNMLQISTEILGVIERNWAAMGQMYGLCGAQIDQKPLISEEDFLFLEESIVRVWMHNLVLVSTSTPGLGVFACDLTSGLPINRPVTDPVSWVWLAEEMDSEPIEGEPCTGVFAVYTALHRENRSDGRVRYVPDDLTFVSTRAVRRVLRDVANSKRREGYQPLNWHDILRTEYPI